MENKKTQNSNDPMYKAFNSAIKEFEKRRERAMYELSSIVSGKSGYEDDTPDKLVKAIDVYVDSEYKLSNAILLRETFFDNNNNNNNSSSSSNEDHQRSENEKRPEDEQSSKDKENNKKDMNNNDDTS